MVKLSPMQKKAGHIHGLSLKDIVDQYEAIKMAKEAGFVLAVENLWYDVVNRAYERESDKMLKKWYDRS